MKTDLYTRTVLTVIAVCLVWICVKDISILPSAQAQYWGESFGETTNSIHRVIITGVDDGIASALPVELSDIDMAVIPIPVSMSD